MATAFVCMVLLELNLNFHLRSMSERKQTAWNKFISSVHARWNVAQIVQRVRSDATLTFDFVTLIIVAG